MSVSCYLAAGVLLGIFASFKNFRKFIQPLYEISKMATYLKNNDITYSIDKNKAGGQSEIIDSLNEVFFASVFCNEMQCKSVTPQILFNY